MFRLIAFLVVCLLSLAACLWLPGVPVPTQQLHRQAQEIAVKAEKKLQEFARPAAPSLTLPDPVPATSASEPKISTPAHPKADAGPTPGETAAIYAKIITQIERERALRRKRK